jgi:hypothetical protein
MLVDPTSSQPLANRARCKRDDKIREAHEIYDLDYRETDQWVCIDRQCAVPMTPCAWSPKKKDGSSYLKAPHFRTHSGHKHQPGCTGTEAQHGGSGDKVPELRSGPPKELPTRVRLTKASPHLLQASSLSSHVDDEEPEHGMSRPHEHTTRSILAACQCYVAYPKRRRTRLHVDFCDGNSYRDVFVQLGTGDKSLVGSTRILYSQIHVMTRIDLACNPLVLPLHYPDWKDTKKIRNLVIDTTAWGEVQRRAFIEKLDQTLHEGRKAFKAYMFERAWVFFVGAERVYDQPEFKFTQPEAAITAFVCNMPLQHRSVRVINTGVRPLVPQGETVANFDVGAGTATPSPAETKPPSNLTLEAQPRTGPKETPETPLHCDLPSAINESLGDKGATRQPVEGQKPLSRSLDALEKERNEARPDAPQNVEYNKDPWVVRVFRRLFSR